MTSVVLPEHFIDVRPKVGKGILGLLAALLLMFTTVTSSIFNISIESPPDDGTQYFYLGAFTAGTPADVSDCGEDITEPCSTLAYWTGTRRSAALSSCTVDEACVVRIAPGTYSGSTDHCIRAEPNVTYEGRAAGNTDLDNYTDVIIDSSSAAGQCSGVGVSDLDGDYTNFVLRDLKIQDAGNIGILLRANNGQTVTNLLIDRVWVEGTINNLGIHIEQMFDQNDDCAATGRRLDGALIVDTKLTENHGTQGGIAVGCATDVDLLRIEAFDNRGVGLSLADCLASPGQTGCNDHDGIVFAGVVGGSIRDSIAGANGEDNFDIGGHYKKTRNIILSGNKGYDAGSRNFKLSGGSIGIKLYNNIFVDGMVEFASCTEDSELINNTILVEDVPAFQMWAWCQNCIIKNNIMKTESSGHAVFISSAWTNSSNTWDSNVVYNVSGNYALQEFSGINGCNVTCGPSCPAVWPSLQANTTLTDSELSTFQSESNSGDWFGSGSGANDIWGLEPTFTSTIIKTDTDYGYITILDAIARDEGETIIDFSDDRDGVSRPQGPAWDIGANEVTP